MNSILVLDGNQRSALAATRSLGRRGLEVIVGEQQQPSMSSCSKFSTDSFAYPSPYDEADAFVDKIAAECHDREVDVLYPMTDISMYHILKNSDAFAGVAIPFGPFEAYEQLSDKWRLFKLAQKLGVSMPLTHFVERASSLADLRHQLRFPLVIKPYRSRLWSNGRWLKAGVHYADSFDELRMIVASMEYLSQHPFLLQEFIHGENQGIFALCNKGTPMFYFANRQLRDKPPSGGVGVVTESIAASPAAKAIIETLFTHVGWHGVAMADVKVCNGKPYLMEVNARFWASAQLPIDCGIDYPWLLYQIATGVPVENIPGYIENQRLRWLVGDFIHFYMNLTGKDLNRYQTPQERRQALAGFWNLCDSNTRFEINRWDDPAPFLCELAQYCGLLGRAENAEGKAQQPAIGLDTG